MELLKGVPGMQKQEERKEEKKTSKFPLFTTYF
jgi:hypothetical protein